MDKESGPLSESEPAAHRKHLGSDGPCAPQTDSNPTINPIGENPAGGNSAGDWSFGRRIEDARAGSDGALGQLLAECRNYLLLVASREVEPRLQAKVAPSDLVQETMHDVLGKFDQFRGTTGAELLTWLGRIVKSRYSSAVAHFQYTQKREISREIPLTGGASNDRPAVEIAAPGMTPGAAAIAHENERTVRRALARLPVDYRRVIELRSWQRLSFVQTGQRMNRSAAAARKLWTRAAEKLGIELVILDDSRRRKS